MQTKATLIASFVLALTMAMPLGWSGSVAGSSTPSPTTYYLALGGSLVTGSGATPGQGYVKDVYANEKAIIPGLQLENLGCGGDSTTRMIHGGNCTYTTGSQLGDAEAFLASHVGAVKFITITVGGDDVDGCATGGVINTTCVQNGLEALATNMPTILGGLRAAGGNVPIVGMVYYDPWLAFYRNGPNGQQAAIASLGLLHQLNSELRGAYKQYQARIAPVQKDFDTWDLALTGSFNGQTLPQDVANICNWTHMCDSTNPNIHTNDIGHAVLATAFEARLKLVP